jgi:hypothetical protein
MTVYKNVIVHLMGHPGVGKKTIAKELCKTFNFRLLDGHMINNLVFPLVRVDGATTLPKEIWGVCHEIRMIVLNTLVTMGNRDFSFVFTNYMVDGDDGDISMLNDMIAICDKIGATYVPVRLLCDPDEHKKRIVTPQRDTDMKATDPALVDEIAHQQTLKTGYKNEFTLDVTPLMPEQAASIILRHIDTLQL